MLAGADLIRRKEGKPAYAMTFTLLLTSDGHKMGKTAKGALWLDENKTSPYEFYQYWRNVDDADVIIGKCYANGRAVDDDCAVVFDVTKLEEYVLPVQQVTVPQTIAQVAEPTGE